MAASNSPGIKPSYRQVNAFLDPERARLFLKICEVQRRNRAELARLILSDWIDATVAGNPGIVTAEAPAVATVPKGC